MLRKFSLVATALLSALTLAAFIVATPSAANAAQSSFVEIGPYFPTDSSAALDLGYSYVLPIDLGSVAAPQLSLSVPLGAGNRYVATGEVRTKGDYYFGIGAGIGKLSQSTGLIGEAFGGIPIHVIPHTWLSVRFYAGTTQGVGSGTVVALRYQLP
jgi:hypothetical protein